MRPWAKMAFCAPHGPGGLRCADCRLPRLSADRVLSRRSRDCKRVDGHLRPGAITPMTFPQLAHDAAKKT